MTRWQRRVGFEQLENRHMLSHVLVVGQDPVVSVQIEDVDVATSAVEFKAPINISDGQGLRGAEIRLSYDTNMLDADASSIHAGSIWPAHDTMVIANVDDAKGTIHAWIFRAEGLDAGGGSLLDVVFRVTDAVKANTTTALDLSSVRLNEDQIWSDPAPQPGLDATDAVVRFSGEPAGSVAPVMVLSSSARTGSRVEPPVRNSDPAASSSNVAGPQRIEDRLSLVARPVAPQAEQVSSIARPAGPPSLGVQRDTRLPALPAQRVGQPTLAALQKPHQETPSMADQVNQVINTSLWQDPSEPVAQNPTVHKTADPPRVPKRICVPVTTWSVGEPSADSGKYLADLDASGPKREAVSDPSASQDRLLPIYELDRVFQQTDSWLPQWF